MSKLGFIFLVTATALLAGTNVVDAVSERDAPFYQHAVVRQLPRTESLLTDVPQRNAILKAGKGAKTVALESLGKTGAGIMEDRQLLSRPLCRKRCCESGSIWQRVDYTAGT